MTTKSSKPIRRVLVLGGGIAGATVAERLGRAGLDVPWVEKEPVIGGHVAATGHEPFNPGQMGTFGYGVIPNVISGLDAERQLADQHRITCLSDGSAPRRVAFIQCVGSRSEHAHRRPEDTNYCSTFCCSYALRIARCMQYDVPETAVTVFYMDIQNFGKDFPASATPATEESVMLQNSSIS